MKLFFFDFWFWIPLLITYSDSPRTNITWPLLMLSRTSMNYSLGERKISHSKNVLQKNTWTVWDQVNDNCELQIYLLQESIEQSLTKRFLYETPRLSDLAFITLVSSVKCLGADLSLDNQTTLTTTIIIHNPYMIESLWLMNDWI